MNLDDEKQAAGGGGARTATSQALPTLRATGTYPGGYM